MRTSGGPDLGGFLQELSRELVSVEWAAVDEAVGRRLEQLAQLLDVECASIVVACAGGGARVTHSAGADTARGTGGTEPRACSVWLAERVREGRTIRADGISEREQAEMAAAFPDAALGGAGLKSYLMLPLVVGGAPLGALAIGCARDDRTWPDDVLTPLTLAANMFASALAHQHARGALEERLEFERLITDFVATLVSVPANVIMERLERGLARLVSHFGVDRAALGRFADDGSLIRVCSVARPGVPPLPARLELPWFVDEVRRGRQVRVHDGSRGLPAEATAERDYIAQTGIRSQLTIPLLNGGRVWGGIGFASFSRPRTWTDEEAQRLGLLGEIMMQVVVRADAERAADQQRDELAHVARVAALGELTAALAHELNQPLMAIRVNAQATRRVLRAGQRADVDEVLGDITEDVTRAGELIRRLRDLLRRREVAKEALEVNDVITAVEGIARTEAHRHGAELVMQTAAELPPIVGDAIQLQQVVLNLVRNAAEAMSGQAGSREVRVRTYRTAADQVTIAVEDEGPPIDEAGLREMFTPFSTTKANGLGIGLAISRAIVEAHAGRLWAERRAGRGLAVKVALPARLRS